MGLCAEAVKWFTYYTYNYLWSSRLSMGGHFGRPKPLTLTTRMKFPHISKLQPMSWRMVRQREASWAEALTRKGTPNLWQKSRTLKSSHPLRLFLKPVTSSLPLLSSLLLTTMTRFRTSIHVQILLKIQTVNRNEVGIVIFNSWYKSEHAAFQWGLYIYSACSSFNWGLLLWGAV